MTLTARIRRCLLPLAATAPAVGSAGGATLDLVESAPVETSLDHADLPGAAEVWPAMIGRARTSLEVAQFYVADASGEALGPVIAAVEAAADRGVRVRILADASFHNIYPDTLDRLGTLPGIEVRLLDLGPRGGVFHAKYLVVDGRDLYVGSQNFDWRSLVHVQELGVRTDAPGVVRAFRDVFESDWSVAGGGPVRPASIPFAGPDTAVYAGETVRLTPVFSPTGQLPDPALWDLPRLVGLIDGAARTVRIQLLTYQVTEDGDRLDDLDAALRRAAARGVDVRLLVSDWSLGPGALEDLRDLQGLDHVEVRYASIPEASRGFIDHARVIHAKYLVVDGHRAWVGTSNWGRGYFHASRNAGLILEGEAPGVRLDSFFADLWDSPHARWLDPSAAYTPPRVARDGEGP